MLLLCVLLAATGPGFVFILGPDAGETTTLTIAEGILTLKHGATLHARHIRVTFFFLESMRRQQRSIFREVPKGGCRIVVCGPCFCSWIWVSVDCMRSISVLHTVMSIPPVCKNLNPTFKFPMPAQVKLSESALTYSTTTKTQPLCKV